MDYAQQQRDPTKHAIGVAFVILMHVLLIYALISGLGRAIVEVVKKPLTATIIEELKLPPPPPPPPPKKVIEQPKIQPPVQTYVPPPDVPVPTTTAPTITGTTTVAPTEPHVIAPPAVVAPPAPPRPAVRHGVTRIAGEDPQYPRSAIKANIDKGQVIARVHVDEAGNVTEVVIVSAVPARHFDRAVIDALSTWKFKPEGEKYIAEVELNFSLKD
jgi:periplasmic protein TonB